MGWTFVILLAVSVLLLSVVHRISDGAQQYGLRAKEDRWAVRPSVPRFDERAAKLMAVLSLVYLALIAAMLPQTPRSGETQRVDAIVFYLVPTAVVWALFWLEFLASVVLHARDWTWRYRAKRLAAALIPPFRLSTPPAPGQPHWIPLVGWRGADKATSRRMEHGFSTPMMVMALLVLPILAVEFFWAENIARGGTLDVLTDVGTRAIWLAFAIEFLVMWSVSPKKLAYCKQHWIDLAIILLPLVSFLRSLRVLRAARLAKVQKMSRVYRLRGVAMRFFRVLLVFKLVDRMGRRVSERRLKMLRETLASKEEELEDLRLEIAALESAHATEVGKSGDESDRTSG